MRARPSSQAVGWAKLSGAYWQASGEREWDFKSSFFVALRMGWASTPAGNAHVHAC